jgi:hypothetical protein
MEFGNEGTEGCATDRPASSRTEGTARHASRKNRCGISRNEDRVFGHVLQHLAFAFRKPGRILGQYFVFESGLIADECDEIMFFK